jgi:DNA repair exonuclease SbcCD ATPase subunit
MKITLKELELINFKGLSGKWSLDPGKNVFLGQNGTGKTTLYDAPTWLLYGKDSAGSAKFDIKTVVDGVPMSKTDHSVFATYDIDGESLKLGKTQREKYRKPRGATEEIKDGNEVVYIVDGEEVKAKEFEAVIAEKFGPWFRLVSDPKHAAKLPWKELRTIISGMARDVDHEQIIDSIPDLRKLLNGKEIEKAKTVADQRKKVIFKGKQSSDNDAGSIGLDQIPTLIKEHRAKIEKAGGMSLKDAKKATVFAGAEVDKAQKAIDDFESGDNSESIAELKRLNDELLKAQTDFQEKKNAALVKDGKRKGELVGIGVAIREAIENLEEHKEKKAELLAAYKLMKVRTLVSHPCQHYGDNCPYHGQEVPADFMERHLEQFNRKLSQDKEENIARGKDVAAEITRIEKHIAELEAKKKELEAVEPDPILEADSNEYIIDLATKIEKLKKDQDASKEEIPHSFYRNREKASMDLKSAQETEAAIKAVDDSVKRIAELEAKKTELSGENDRIQKFLALYDEYNKQVAERTEGPVNEMFEVVNFRMFEKLEKTEDGEQVLKPACTVMDKQYRSYDGALSNGEKIQAGLDMIRTFSKHFGVEACVFVDNAESVTGSIDLNCQTIELRASKDHETLTQGV